MQCQKLVNSSLKNRFLALTQILIVACSCEDNYFFLQKLFYEISGTFSTFGANSNHLINLYRYVQCSLFSNFLNNKSILYS